MSIEQLCSSDLALDKYHFKWKQAIKYVTLRLEWLESKYADPSFDYWMEVRTKYLEFGGMYK